MNSNPKYFPDIAKAELVDRQVAFMAQDTEFGFVDPVMVTKQSNDKKMN